MPMSMRPSSVAHEAACKARHQGHAELLTGQQESVARGVLPRAYIYILATEYTYRHIHTHLYRMSLTRTLRMYIYIYICVYICIYIYVNEYNICIYIYMQHSILKTDNIGIHRNTSIDIYVL